MTRLLDTNVCVGLLKSPCSTMILQRLLSLPQEEVVLCSVVRAELAYGARRSRNAQQNLAEVHKFCSQFSSLPFDDAAAEFYGRIRSHLASQGTPIGPNDLMIASIALTHDLTLVTHNVKEFGRVPELEIEDWEA